ncbi:low molecular weight phosphotyrosine protein phosphatase [Aquibacillus koreensis]|uniref:protein-tyrosine-phosphatase n=1 Tax=Aquibacillus koreensis TaxID=279446 RepID=A0A9X3WP48_9BACI|nr:low molecular weight protein-tyrosine-phosphatase [Aquibacillus koreensis]MCT2534439.1 low molecular weight phosphotyrosine protein phosphatase [Aquibacillus koreensis]MDC3421746.1 low molecular weight phosphotyrosine protein phosphatase [Aquibacillus koreensis]
MIKVLFVCLGNICRSPMAEAIFRHLVKEEGIEDQFIIDSAGIGRWHVGNPPHEGTRNLLTEKTISYEGITARQIHVNDWDEFDYIIAMDEKNMSDLHALREAHDQVVVKRLMDYVENPKEKNVPDPYFTNNFEYTYELVDEGCKQLLKQIKTVHKQG